MIILQGEIYLDESHVAALKDEPAYVKKLQEKYRIVIYSGRFREVDRTLIEDFLKRYEVPYDEIVLEKPIARFMIDDRGLHHKTWDETLKEIKERENSDIDYLCGVKD